MKRSGFTVLRIGQRSLDCSRHRDGLHVHDPLRSHPIPLAMWLDAERAIRVKAGMQVKKLLRAAQ